MIAAVSAGVLFGLTAGFSPGPLLTLVVAQTLAHGVREGVKVALAPLLTDLPIIALAALASARIARFEGALGAISLAGAGFVAFLAWGSLRTSGPAVGAEAGAPRSLRKGALVNVLNPHPYLFWTTVGVPTMVRAAAADGPPAAAAFVGAFLALLAGSKVLIAVAVGRSRAVLAGRTYAWTMRALGVLLFAFALLLLRDGLALLGWLAS